MTFGACNVASSAVLSERSAAVGSVAKDKPAKARFETRKETSRSVTCGSGVGANETRPWRRWAVSAGYCTQRALPAGSNTICSPVSLLTDPSGPLPEVSFKNA